MLPFCAPVLNAVLSSLSHAQTHRPAALLPAPPGPSPPDPRRRHPEEELREAAARADTSLRALLHQSNAAQFEMGAPAPLAHPAGARRRSAQRALVE